MTMHKFDLLRDFMQMLGRPVPANWKEMVSKSLIKELYTQSTEQCFDEFKDKLEQISQDLGLALNLDLAELTFSPHKVTPGWRDGMLYFDQSIYGGTNVVEFYRFIEQMVVPIPLIGKQIKYQSELLTENI